MGEPDLLELLQIAGPLDRRDGLGGRRVHLVS